MSIMVRKVSHRRSFWQRYGAGYLFVLPAMTFLAVFAIFPMFYALYLSFFKYRIPHPPSFLAFQNYLEMFGDPLFWSSFRNTLLYTVASVILGLSLSLLVATLLHRQLRGMRFFRVSYFFPSITSTAVSAMIFLWLFDYQMGLFNYFLLALGQSRIPWLIDPNWAMFSVIAVGSWRGISYNIPIFLAGLESVPQTYYEAADIDGANAIQKFVFITLPSIVPIIVFTVIMSVIGSFQIIATVDILTDGGPFNSTMVSVKYIFRQAFEYNRMGYSSAMSIFIFVILLFFTYQQMRGSFASNQR